MVPLTNQFYDSNDVFNFIAIYNHFRNVSSRIKEAQYQFVLILMYLFSFRKSKFDRIRDWIKLSRIKIRVFVKHGAFYWSVLVMVFLNTCIVATNHYRQPLWLTKFQGTFFKNNLLMSKSLFNLFKVPGIVTRARSHLQQ